jgi:hypothetical protein
VKSPSSDPSKTPPAEGALSRALGELYGAPFDNFVAFRREIVARLRAAGDVTAARSLSAAGKPTRTAWALNQMARRRPDLLATIVETWKEAAAAPKSADAGTIRETARHYREAVADAVREARAILASDAVSLSALQVRRMSETLQALASDDVERKRLIGGHLTHDVAVEDPFAGLEIGARSGPAGPTLIDLPSRRADEETARERVADRVREARQRAIDDASARIATLEVSISGARQVAADAESVLAEARAGSDKAHAAVKDLERELARARAHLETLSR